MFEQELEQLGLTSGEAKVYESLVVLGSSTVGPVVKRSGVAYSNIYEILERLIQKGLVSFVIREKTKHFQAVAPLRLKDFLEKQENDVQERKKILDTLLPKINDLRSPQKPQEAEVFVGVKGLLTAYERFVEGADSRDVVHFFYVHDPAYYEKAAIFYKKTWHLFKKLKSCLGIANQEYRNSGLVNDYPKIIQQRYVPFPVPGNIDILRDKVLFVAWADKP
ncbi:MAG: helix-turn-helix domain-containing protein, partial [Candidatus Woesearchaeota archaeon]|nr:helix-turn-helix domain-containing protein [Candidatus Woesearchaeota archaeon]